MPAKQITIGTCTLEVLQGDITQIPVDAIVNAANSLLAGGGGVDGAIHSAAGPTLMQELKKYDGCPTGSAVITSAGRLPAQFVIHAVGPVYRGGNHGEAELLASCYKTALRLAAEHGCQSVSFPSISTGVYGYPVAEAAKTALTAIAEAVRENASWRYTIKLVQFSNANYNTYCDLLPLIAAQHTAAQTS